MVDTVIVQPEEQPDPAMEALKEQESNQGSQDSSQEELILGKYKDQKALEDAYTSLQKEFTKMKQNGQVAEEPTEVAPTQEGEGSPPTDEQSVESNVPDFSKYTQELADKGQLSEDSYSELQKQGYPKEMVDSYIAGQQAKQDAQQQQAWNSMAEYVGGMDNLKAMATWAQESYSEAEISTLNAALNGSENEQQMALTALQARYTSANDQPNLLSGKASSNAVGFRSYAEMSAAMQDPRYNVDPAYTRDVEDKARVSKL